MCTYLLIPSSRGLFHAFTTGLPATFSIKRSDVSDKKCQKSVSQFTISDFFPIEKAAIVSLSKGNRQKYEHLFLYPRLFCSKGGSKRSKMASEKSYLRKNNLASMAY